MSAKSFVLETMRKQGRAAALALQEKAPNMSGTELNAENAYIPFFLASKTKINMLQRFAGFICKSSAGRVVKLLQPYDSDVYPAEPEELPAQWGFIWSKDPKHALPFVAISTSPYMIGDCCVDGSNTYRSKIDNNVWSPEAYPSAWELVK